MEPLRRAAAQVLRAPRRLPAVAAAGTAISTLVFLQAPGRLVADTKLDLAVDPVGLMARGLHLWDSESALGAVTNQAVGYVFPMGPFFALGRAVAVPAWVVQRAWVSLLLVVAVWGALRLARELRIGTETTRLVSASAYALGPMTAALAGTTAHLLPPALLPWALVPLVRAAQGGSIRRGAARSGVAVACMGGVNATTVLAVLPAPAIYLLTRRRGPRRRRLTAWWGAAVVMATAWWTWPLLLQARHGFDFLPFTEGASVTTGAASATEVLRGGGSWLEFLQVNGPWAQGAWLSAALPAAVLASVLLAAAGLAGLARRDCPERAFLVLTLLTGVAVMGVGYAGPLGGPFAGTIRELLDGPLSGLRNVAKFSPLVHLPLALGLGHLLGAVTVTRAFRDHHRGAAAVQRRLVVLAALVAVAATAAPLVRGRFFPDGSFESVPGHWRATAAWLDEHSGGGRALVVPAAPFGEYVWGRPLDEPLQPLASSPWAVRDIIPLGSAGGIRALDAVEGVLAGGLGTPALAPALARMGVRHVVVRNDLDWRRSEAPRPLQVRSVLAESPGLRRVARLGPPLAGLLPGPPVDAFEHEERSLRAVEIYEVSARPGPVSLVGEGELAVVAGGPEAAAELPLLAPEAGASILAGAPGSGELHAEGAVAVATDLLRRRDVEFGLVRRNASVVLPPGAPSPHTGEAPRDYPVDGDGVTTRLVERGGTVTASSYGSALHRLPQFGPAGAFDADPATSWVSAAGDGAAGEWIQIDLAEPRHVEEITVRPLADGPWRPHVRTVAVTAAAGTTHHPLPPGEGPVTLAVEPGRTAFVRVTLAEVDARRDPFSTAGAGLREVTVPGVRYERWLEVPPPPGPGRQVVALHSGVDRSSLFLGAVDREEAVMRRVVRTTRPGRFAISGSAVVLPGEQRDALAALAPDAPVDLPCGSGPTLAVDGRVVPTSLSGTARDVAEYRPLDLRGCGGTVELAAGAHRLAEAGGGVKVTALAMAEGRPGPAAPTRARDVEVEGWGTVDGRLRIGSGAPAVLVVHQTFRSGWRAELAGARLAPVMVDGWQQGWRVPAGAGGVVEVAFAPDRAFRAGLVASGGLALLLVALAFVPARRRSPLASPPPLRSAALGRTLVVVGTAVLMAVGGPVAAAAAVVTLLLPARLMSLLPALKGRSGPWLGGLALAGAGVVAAAGAGSHPLSGAGAFDPAAQALALAAVVALVGSNRPEGRESPAAAGRRQPGRTVPNVPPFVPDHRRARPNGPRGDGIGDLPTAPYGHAEAGAPGSAPSASGLGRQRDAQPQ